ncbi:MAG: NB-ARC domain-containing protein [Actinomycetota bacterium]|nr:NB-ARC domain-containing protein [Actinomycetota bacterium]
MPELPEGSQFAFGSHNVQADRGSTANLTLNNYADVSPRPVEPERFEEARRLLGEMPLEELPKRAELPLGSRMPLSRNPLFVGREEELRALAEGLKAEASGGAGQVAIVAATGLGGVGKTQLVTEFVYRYGQYFSGGVFWLSFADTGTVAAEIASCGGTGRMRIRPDFHALPLEDQIQEVMAAWRGELPRLLVFDNCEDEALLTKWGPTTGGCRVLVTSRKQSWDPVLGVKVLALDVLSREDSVMLLREYCGDLSADDPDLYAIAEELGDLPLALDLAGRYLRRYRYAITPAQYLDRLRRLSPLEHRSLREGGVLPTGQEQNVARTFALSLGRLDVADPADRLAVKLLARAARFASGEQMPRGLLLSTLDLPDDPDEALVAEDASGRLIDLGLLAVDE